MARKLVLLLLTFASCSKGPEEDLAAIAQARSLAAEWALVNAQDREGHLTRAYVDAMHQSVRGELQSTFKSRRHPDSSYGNELKLLALEPSDAAPEKLEVYVKALQREEQALESA